MVVRKEIELGGRKLLIETGKMARQADGAVWVQYGETAILATAVSSDKPVTGTDFMPLSVEYRERAYAAGKIPGGFFKREGKPSEKEVVSARLTDRPIRPLFPDDYRNEVQVIIYVISADQENDADILGPIGASAALSISDIPFLGPIASVRVGKVNGEYVINPTFAQLEESELDVIIAGSSDSIAMVEGWSNEISEEDMLQALDFGHEAIKKIVELQNELVKEIGRPKRSYEPAAIPEELQKEVRARAESKMVEIVQIAEKKERSTAIKTLVEEIAQSLEETFPDASGMIAAVVGDIEKEIMRKNILEKGKRLDGRSLKDIRPITCEIGLIPRAHGSALFTRGQTQSLSATTLGTKMDEQKIEGLEGGTWKRYMLHYNFPPFSVGEVKPMRGPGRREIGHGQLAERALKPVIPDDTEFPYTIRIVSDIMESNGSSSMATVCAGSLSLMDAGVPVKAAVAGIAMGLIKENDKVAILTDILGDEDHMGDMDFKVAGTSEGITAFQMDIKIKGISFEIMREALQQAREARLQILEIMNQTIDHPRDAISKYAPRIMSIQVPVDTIGAIIGPGGKTIREIIDKTGVTIDIDDDGKVTIASADMEAAEEAKRIVQSYSEVPEEGKVYKGKVKKILNFGAIVEILPGKEGLLHISELEYHRVNKVEDILHVGDMVEVKLLKVERDGKLDLSRKALLEKPEGYVEQQRPSFRSSNGQRRRSDVNRNSKRR
ncbi:MAG: polyribonucleotide nucleotidyltransferase [Calditrichaeota bacterium]|nr:polyribonucleotide nucleotidyltransferase [Calditrichota bacterium]